MIKILFVCHGNICRSIMAEYMAKEIINQRKLKDTFYFDSAGTSSEEYGNPIHRGAKKKLGEYGIPIGNHTARQLTKKDYDYFDFLIGMDQYNISNMKRLFNNDPDHKIFKMLSFIGSDEDVDDPWWDGNFERTYRQLLPSINALIDCIISKR